MSVSFPQITIGSTSIKLGHLFIGLSIILAAVTGLVFKAVVVDASPAPATLTRPIVVAKVQVPAGSVIQQSDLQVVEWDANHLPTTQVYNTAQPLVGRVVTDDLYPGQPVSQQVLAGENSTGGLKVLIPKGLRAMTVAVSEVKGVAGFVKPGDQVDVIATFRNFGNNDVQVTRTVLQNVLVIAAAQQMANKENAQAGETARLVTSATLAISPDQIEKLALADETGSVRLVLRPEGDQSINPVNGVTTQELIGHAAPSVSKSSGTGRANHTAAARPARSYNTAVRGQVVEMLDGKNRFALQF